MVLEWLAVILLCAFLEVITVNLVTIWFIISGIVALIISLFNGSLVLQTGVFVILGVFLLFTTRRPLQRMVNVLRERTNLDRIYDMSGVVIEEISMYKAGAVKVDGKVWTAVSDENISIGSIVKVLEINSTKLKVKKVED